MKKPCNFKNFEALEIATEELETIKGGNWEALLQLFGGDDAPNAGIGQPIIHGAYPPPWEQEQD